MKMTQRIGATIMLLVAAMVTQAQKPAAEPQAGDYIQSAEALAQKGKHAEVIALLHEAETKGIKHLEIFALKGQSYQAMGNLAEALTAFTQALAINPNYTPALVGRARLWLQASQFDKAIADATRLIDAGIPAYEIRAAAQLRRAEMLMAKGAEEKAALNAMGGALRDYSSLIEDRTRRGQTALYAHDKRGQVLMNLRAYDLAIAEYDRALAIEDHAWAHANRARSLARLKRFDEAAAEFGKALAREQNAYVLLERAELFAHQAKEKAALADVAKAVDLAPDDPRIKSGAATLRKRIPEIVAQAKNAGDAGDKAITKEMADIAKRADAAFMAKQYADAMLGYNRLIGLGHPDAYRKRGILLAKAQAAPQAVGDFSKAIARHGETQPDLIWLRAGQLLELGADDLALQEYQRSFKLGVKHPGSHLGAGVLHDRAGRHREAIADFTLDIEAGSEDPYAWLSRGLAYEHLAEYDRAIADYKTAITKSADGSQLKIIALNSRVIAQQRKQMQDILTLIERGDAQGLAKLMNPLVQKYIDEKSLAQRLRVVRQRFGKPLRASLTHLKLADLRITGTLKFENGDVNSEFLFDSAGWLVGFSLKRGDFGVDTFDTLHNTDKLAEVARKFWQLVYAEKGEDAYKLIVPAEAKNGLPLEQFLRFANPLAERVGKAGVKSTALHVVRLHKPVKPGERPSLDIYHLIESNDLRYNPARMTLEIIAENDGKPTPRVVDFQTGEFSDAYPFHDFSDESACFRAIASADADEVIKLIHPNQRSRVNPAVLKAFLTQLNEKLGSFRTIKLDQFHALTRYRNAIRTTAARGSVEFAKGTVPAECALQFGWLDSFDIKTDVAGWTKRIADMAAFQKQGELFLKELINGDPQQAHAMLPAGFQKQTSVEELAKIKQACAERIGTAKQITFVSKEYLVDSGDWKFNYKVVTDKLETTGSVTFAFDAFGGSIYSYNVSFNPIRQPDGRR